MLHSDNVHLNNEPRYVSRQNKQTQKANMKNEQIIMAMMRSPRQTYEPSYCKLKLRVDIEFHFMKLV